MDDKTKVANGESDQKCSCLLCHGHMCHRCGSRRGFYLLKVLITVVILLLVFWSGFSIGRAATGSRARFLGTGRSGYGRYPQMDNNGQPMPMGSNGSAGGGAANPGVPGMPGGMNLQGQGAPGSGSNTQPSAQ